MPASLKPRSGVVRVLLVTASDEELRAFGLPLHRERFAVTRAADLATGLDALAHESFDAAIVSHPLPDADVIASCAALSQVPGAPPWILLDSLDPFEQTIPAAIRPARMLRKPIDAAKLGALLREVMEEPTGEARAPAVGTAPLGFAAALLQLARDRETGVLEVRTESVCTRIFLAGGVPVSAEGGSLRDTLGRMLLRRGDLAEADYVRVIERMTQSLVDNEPQRLGEVLVELGLLSGEEVRRALETQLFEKVTACFRWTEARWTFSEFDELPEGIEPLSLPPVEQLVLAGLREHTPPAAIAAWLEPRGHERPRLRRPPAVLRAQLQLDAGGLHILEGVDGRRTLAALAREAEGAPALLAALLLVDALDLGTNSPPVARARETVRVPFAREVVGRRNAAAPSGPAAPDEKPDRNSAQQRLEAEKCFRSGQQLLGADKLGEAVRQLRHAVELQPGEPEYMAAEAWASYLEARHAVRVGRARATVAARKWLEADPKAVRVHTLLGRLALDDGDRERATREFELALLRDPEDDDAKRGLKQARG